MLNDTVFDTIGFMISLIISEHFDASVNSLSTACGLPVGQTRKYLSTLFHNKILQSCFSPSPEIDENDDPNEILSTFQRKIINGECDDASIYFINMNLSNDIFDFLLVPITSSEAGCITKEYPQLIKHQRTNSFEIKDAIDSIPEYITKRQDIVYRAIERRKKISFSYKSPRFNQTRIVCSPVAVIQNLTSRTLYIKASDDNLYRIDRIKSNIHILPENADLTASKENPFQKYFWGTEEKEHGHPIHVKLRIANETKNIIQKIEHDTRLRKRTRKLYQDGEYLYYEDDVLGLQDFRRWVRSYGSSITVIEPQTLIEDIVAGAEKTLSYYESLNSSLKKP